MAEIATNLDFNKQYNAKLERHRFNQVNRTFDEPQNKRICCHQEAATNSSMVTSPNLIVDAGVAEEHKVQIEQPHSKV